jgi:L-galactose dehydrogenase/L-glyceraldehyde 3-phosphate reductase
MNQRPLGNSDTTFSQLGFGCGAVGGLIVRGDRAEAIRSVERAIELGITYFDTAASYGDGQSETHLGEILRDLDVEDKVKVGTKIRISGEEIDRIEETTIASLEASLKRLGREQVDLIQMHTRAVPERSPGEGAVDLSCIERTIDVFERMREQGKVRYCGLNGLGDIPTLQNAIRQFGDRIDSIQIPYSLLNPTPELDLPSFPFQNYENLIGLAQEKGVGVIAIRVLAAGALSGSADRHQNAGGGSPIASSDTFEQAVALAQRFRVLVDRGIVEDLVEAAIRFVMSNPGVTTALVGISSFEQFEHAARAAEKGALPEEAFPLLDEAWSGFPR